MRASRDARSEPWIIRHGETEWSATGRHTRVTDAPGDVVLVAHGHLLRVLATRGPGLGPVAGSCFALDAASVSVLAQEREHRLVRLWNDLSHIAPGPGRNE